MSDRDAFGNPIDSGTPAAAVAARTDAAAREASTLGWVALSLAIGGIFFLPVVLSIPAIILGHKAKRDMPPGRSTANATAALIIGYVMLVVGVALIGLLVAVIVSFPSG